MTNFRLSSTRVPIVQVLTVAIGGDDFKASSKCLGVVAVCLYLEVMVVLYFQEIVFCLGGVVALIIYLENFTIV